MAQVRSVIGQAVALLRPGGTLVRKSLMCQWKRRYVCSCRVNEWKNRRHP
jgi:hypothetical protein